MKAPWLRTNQAEEDIKAEDAEADLEEEEAEAVAATTTTKDPDPPTSLSNMVIVKTLNTTCM